MPSSHKKSPPTALKKKTMASAQAKVSLTKNKRKKATLQNDGSYLDPVTIHWKGSTIRLEISPKFNRMTKSNLCYMILKHLMINCLVELIN